MKFSQLKSIVTAAALISSTMVLSAEAGSMRGKSGHTASGSASIAGSTVKLSSNFKFDGGPDVYVAVKQGGKGVKLLGKLRSNKGAQSYKLPSGTKKSDVDQIILWCKKYNVALGAASAN